jgi:type II secretory pathway pseudopilin PulG
MIVALIMAAVTAGSIQFVGIATVQSRRSAMLHNLRQLRQAVEQYKIEHNGQVPVLFKETLPQLTHPTNVDGVPGEAGPHHPHGPYLRFGIPANPVTGMSKITATDTFPPPAASGNGGWLYHQPSGSIAPDLPDCLED